MQKYILFACKVKMEDRQKNNKLQEKAWLSK